MYRYTIENTNVFDVSKNNAGECGLAKVQIICFFPLVIKDERAQGKKKQLCFPLRINQQFVKCSKMCNSSLKQK